MNWRLIEDGAHSGAWNMAMDEALLLAQATRDALPSLRFYQWQPSCLSLGRLQRGFEPPPGLDWVRRPTGGRAVWHQHEVTYCAVFPASILPAGATSVVGAYNWLSSGFLRGLQDLGIRAELSSGRQAAVKSTSDGAGAHRDNCFLAAAQCDTVVAGRKLIGAAQCRKAVGERTLILQHGSLLLDIDDGAWRKALGGGTNDTMEQVVSLSALGLYVSREDVMAALVQGMEAVLGVQWQEDAPDEREVQMATCLYGEKYTQGLWNREGREPESVWGQTASNWR